MESATYHTAALIDSGAEDYMIETAMLKVFASDQLWRIVNDTLQIWGGAGFFTDQPFERMMRDARLNQIGEGANDVLRCFIAMVGMRHLKKEGDELMKTPWKMYKMVNSVPRIPVKHEHLRYHARHLAKQISSLSWACKFAGLKFKEGILDQQAVQGRLGDIATELFMASCVYSRITSLLVNGTLPESTKMHDVATGMLYMRLAFQRNTQRFNELKVNFDTDMEKVADRWLKYKFQDWVLSPEA
jgi:alkylation response protein AidB-like acyl-CoA dehydrogenase